jgi:hypothetical protein
MMSNLSEESWDSYSDSYSPLCTPSVSFYWLSKVYYYQEATKLLKCHPGRTITHYHVTGLFAEAYGNAATSHSALRAFAQTGIFPGNPDIFSDFVISPSDTLTHTKQTISQTYQHLSVMPVP